MDKILIVDDNVINRKLLSNIINDKYSVLEAQNGREAIAILSSIRDISAVLLDLVMPDMNGFEVLKFIRNSSFLSEMPVIIQTENTSETFEMEALNAGATDFVVKPYKPSVIRTRLGNVINTRKMLNEISNLNSDELTGLMSVNEFYFAGTRWINENLEEEFDVVAIDIVHFSIINDSKGIEGGNKILRTMAERIKSIQQELMFLATRVYADRFILLIRRREGYVQRLIDEADKATELYQNEMNVHFKFGIYEITEKEDVKLSNICGRAFSATNLLKEYYGNGYAYYNEQLHKQIVYEEHINDEMENALKEEQFEVYFQPKYDLFTNAIAGAEALVRWIHPVDGIVPPGNFIPIFEKNGFIVKLDQFVWEKTASIISKWFTIGNKIVPVSVNISRVDIERIDVVKTLEDIVHKYQIQPELLHLEITESAYMQDTEMIIQVVSSLKEKGFIIEMDDFGSGYSSLNMLAKLPINIIKLDMKFIQSLESSQNSKTIIEYTIGLAKWMDLPVVAEGVETDEQLKLLKKLECNYVQGYVFAKPMPEEQFEILLYSHDTDKTITVDDNELLIKETNSKYHMLIVEDIKLNRAIIRSYFEDAFSIVEATNGEVALDYLNTGKRVDIIILDIYMPILNGYDFLRQLKKNDDLKKIPVLVISAQSNFYEKEKVLKLGADAFMAKPFTPENIINRVRILLRANSVLEDMNVWDLSDTINNPWIIDIFESVFVVDTRTGRLCDIIGQKVIKTNRTYKSLISKDIFHNSLEKMEATGKKCITNLDNDHKLYSRLINVNNSQYMICFLTNCKAE